ncbi:MAG: hypothetical protein KA802_17150 [Saprospiraceae bacterium]|nr:hypothetical protein [Saprospiraceae bacterium]
MNIKNLMVGHGMYLPMYYDNGYFLLDSYSLHINVLYNNSSDNGELKMKIMVE